MASIDSVKLPNGSEYDINEKLASYTNGNLVEADANGNLKDSGIAKSTIGDKQNKTLDTSVESQSTVEGALGALSSNKQPKTMSTTVESQTTVEGALGALSTNKQAKTLTASVESENTVEEALSALSTNKQAKNLASSVESQTTVETALSALSTNKQPKTLATAITVDGTSETTVEGALGAINTLAASNKTALASKQNSSITPITIEGTSRSTVETALAGLNTYVNHENDAITAITNVYGAKNMIPYPYYDTSKTENGITFTDIGDGTVTVSGTASAEAIFILVAENKMDLPDNLDLIMNGCPSGHSGISIQYYNAVDDAKADRGNGVLFQRYSSTTYPLQGISISIASGTVISTPITFKPMIRDARISEDTYEPYAMTNRELTEKVNANEGGTPVSLGAITTDYVAPNDGYLYIKSATTANAGEIAFDVRDSTGDIRLCSLLYQQPNKQYAEGTGVFVKRGMRIRKNVMTGNSEAYFTPLT